MAAVREDAEVVIVGAGAGGLALGAALAREGVSALILEAGDGIRPLPRGELLQPNGLRALAELGVLERLRSPEVPVIRTIRFHGPGGRLLGVADYRRLDPPYDHAIGCPPHRLRRLLLEHRGGTEVWWNARVDGLERDGRGWCVRVQTPDGARRVRCRVVVAADGARSQVRRLLGIRGRVRAYRDAYALTVLPRPAGFPDEVQQYLGGGTLLGLIPIGPQELYLYWYVPARRLDAFWREGPSRWSATLRRVAPDVADALTLPPAEAWMGIIPTRVDAETWVVDGGALLGDAAHALNPNAAQGTNLALADAAALAPVLAGALRRGRVDAAALAPYERARRPAAVLAQRAGEEAARLWTSASPLLAWITARVMANLGRDPDLARRVVAQAAGLSDRPLTWAERWRLLA